MSEHDDNLSSDPFSTEQDNETGAESGLDPAQADLGHLQPDHFFYQAPFDGPENVPVPPDMPQDHFVSESEPDQEQEPENEEDDEQKEDPYQDQHQSLDQRPQVNLKKIPFRHTSSERKNVAKMMVRRFISGHSRRAMQTIYDRYNVPEDWKNGVGNMLEQIKGVERAETGGKMKKDYTGLLKGMLSCPPSCYLLCLNMIQWLEERTNRPRMKRSAVVNFDIVEDYVQFMRSKIEADRVVIQE
ncbi:MAG: hypothetical protein P4M11_09240 [Candidatus Pacebacteria bacterium]|nr:hypothetical protein [Candidatus Paceibacterota bacterium]